MIYFFQTHLSLFIFMLVILGLCMGSFLNVVIYRLPKMIMRTWEENHSASTEQDTASLNLVSPSSHCPNCKKKIPFYLNIPLLGYFLAGRKCHFCAQKISSLYPLVEFFSGVSAGLIAYQWGVNWETLAALVFTWLLIPLIFIDIKHQLLPDILTLLGIWIGLSVNLFNLFAPIEDAVIGTVAGYVSLWVIAQLFRIIKKREGIGYGDFKLFAMLGAWQGWEDLPFILLQASLLGLLISLIRLLLKKQKFDTPVAFGPYLAISGWITLFFGKYIMSFYQSLFSMILGWE